MSRYEYTEPRAWSTTNTWAQRLQGRGYAAAAVNVRSASPSSPARREICLGLIALGVLAIATACPAAPAPAASEAEPAASPGPSPSRVQQGPEIIAAPADGDVVEYVNSERLRAQADDRQLLVYVGASWCEPCRYFHDAAVDGSLDQVFPRLRLLEFDLDRDRDRLTAAGYSSRMIPLFVVPGPDGRAGPRRTEGGIKGPRAVDNLQPRLEALLRLRRAIKTELLAEDKPSTERVEFAQHDRAASADRHP
jgi:thiol-disulfide isomerase/thioredoxin